MNFVIFCIVAFLLYFGGKFFFSLQKDKDDINIPGGITGKFEVILNSLNDSIFAGKANVTRLDDRSCNLYKDGSNQIINLHYSTGHLTITWKYKYFQKETVHQKQFNYVRNLSIFEQSEIASKFLEEGRKVIGDHKKSVLNPVLSKDELMRQALNNAITEYSEMMNKVTSIEYVLAFMEKKKEIDLSFDSENEFIPLYGSQLPVWAGYMTPYIKTILPRIFKDLDILKVRIYHEDKAVVITDKMPPISAEYILSITFANEELSIGLFNSSISGGIFEKKYSKNLLMMDKNPQIIEAANFLRAAGVKF